MREADNNFTSMPPWYSRMSLSCHDYTEKLPEGVVQTELSMPVVRFPNGILRIVVAGDTRLADKTSAVVEIAKFPITEIVTTKVVAGTESKDRLGRPVFQLKKTGPRGYFGDIETVDSGINAITAISYYGKGISMMVAENSSGGRKVLSGITEKEMNLFINACKFGMDTRNSRK